MTRDEIQLKLKENFSQLNFSPDENNREALYIPAASLAKIAEFLKKSPELAFDLLNFVTAVDYEDKFELIYQFSSITHHHRLALKAVLSRENPEIASLAIIYPTANWHERETFDLFGVKFINHPNLQRIFMPEDWDGYPMRKDFVHENLIHLPEVA